MLNLKIGRSALESGRLQNFGLICFVIVVANILVASCYEVAIGKVHNMQNNLF